MDDDLAAVLATPPGEFVAARDALARRLRAERRRDEARAVSGLRRPTFADWALNRVALDQPEVVDAAAQAVAELRAAQEAALEDAGADERLRRAMVTTREIRARVRSAGEALLRGAGRPATDLNALTDRVNELLGHPALIDQWGAGRLGTGAVGETDLFAGLELPATVRPTTRTAPGKGPAADRRSRRARPPTDADGSTTEPIDAQEALERAAREEAARRQRLGAAVQEAEAAFAAANARADEAARQAARADERRERARTEFDDATAEAATAAEAMVAAEADRASARQALERARVALGAS